MQNTFFSQADLNHEQRVLFVEGFSYQDTVFLFFIFEGQHAKTVRLDPEYNCLSKKVMIQIMNPNGPLR